MFGRDGEALSTLEQSDVICIGWYISVLKEHSEHFWDDAPNTPHVRFLIVLFLTKDYFRRTVAASEAVWRLGPPRFAVIFFGRQWSGHAKVAQLDTAVLRNENVAWLEVPVDDLRWVQEMQTKQQIIKDCDNLLLSHIVTAGHQVWKIVGHELHNQEYFLQVTLLRAFWVEGVQ